ncbi:MAG: endonuclease/exonuclease/phosphatase family protein [Gemmatimonadetes bacterium]|nr:endonuclease/exonuclease/phosphatase family protein [Gemmatimonadota bacterium]
MPVARIRRAFIGLAAGWLTAACHLPRVGARGDATLRVMTFNIQYGGGDLARIANTIRAADPDVVALQEVDVHWSARSGFTDQATELARLLGLAVRFAPIYRVPSADSSAPPREFGVALLCRMPIIAFTNHAILRHSTLTADARPEPMPGFLEASISVRGTPVRLFNTHLDYRGDPTVRRQQVREMLAIIGTTEQPALLFGDLNALPNAPELQPLFSRLHDLWPTAQDPGFTFPASSPVRRIDFILASPHFARDSAFVPLPEASDHRPVVMTLRLRGR